MSTRALILMFGLIIRLLGIIYIAAAGELDVLAGTDSLSFFLEAQQIANGGAFLSFDIGWHPYVDLMGALMGLMGVNIVIMCLFSTAGWLLTATILDKALASLSTSDANRNVAAAIISFMPTSIFMTVIPLREPFQMLGVVLIGFSMLKIVGFKQGRYWGLLAVGLFISGITHMAMAATALISVAITFLYQVIISANRLPAARLVVAIALGFVAFALVLLLVESRSYDTSKGIFDVVNEFQQTGIHLDARAQYKTEVGASGGFSTIILIVTGFVQFMLEPFPWRISTFGDVVVFVENVVRVTLIITAIRGIRTQRGPRRATGFAFMLLYVIGEVMWSLGTINWGTAARHHVPQMTLLLISCMSVRPMFFFRKRNMAGMRLAV